METPRPSSSDAESSGAGTYRALLIANSTFPRDSANLPDLEGPRSDPVLLREALCDSRTGVFAPADVRVVAERTMSEVLGEIEEACRRCGRHDVLLLYYSGHGLLDQAGELFLCCRDSRSDRLRSTAVKASDVSEIVEQSAAATTIVVVDCCYSGRFKGTGAAVAGALAGAGRFVLTSSRSTELARDTDIENQASVFTSCLVDGLAEGAADRHGDGSVYLGDVYDYVHAALVSDGRPIPQKRFEGHGDVVIARRAVDSSIEAAGDAAPHWRLRSEPRPASSPKRTPARTTRPAFAASTRFPVRNRAMLWRVLYLAAVSTLAGWSGWRLYQRGQETYPDGVFNTDAANGQAAQIVLWGIVSGFMLLLAVGTLINCLFPSHITLSRSGLTARQFTGRGIAVWRTTIPWVQIDRVTITYQGTKPWLWITLESGRPDGKNLFWRKRDGVLALPLQGLADDLRTFDDALAHYATHRHQPAVVD